jgi:hypothetical protein
MAYLASLVRTSAYLGLPLAAIDKTIRSKPNLLGLKPKKASRLPEGVR